VSRITPIGAARPPLRSSDQKGIHDIRRLPDAEFDGVWDSIILPPGLKDRVLAQAVLNFTARARLQQVHLPVHGIILFVGPAGTGKTSLARGVASRTAASLSGALTFIEVDPHGLASAAHGKTQQASRTFSARCSPNNLPQALASFCSMKSRRSPPTAAR
jgi:hypothetical protein